MVLSLDVSLLDKAGLTLPQRRHDSGTVEGPAHTMSGEPGEQIGKVAHGALLDLMLRAAADVRAWVRTCGGGPLSLSPARRATPGRRAPPRLRSPARS